MHEMHFKSEDGRDLQLISDGKTVWVNDEEGACVGRFGSGGVDVHRPAGEQELHGQCLDCIKGEPFRLPPSWMWKAFKRSMKKHYGISIPDGLVKLRGE